MLVSGDGGIICGQRKKEKFGGEQTTYKRREAILGSTHVCDAIQISDMVFLPQDTANVERSGEGCS